MKSECKLLLSKKVIQFKPFLLTISSYEVHLRLLFKPFITYQSTFWEMICIRLLVNLSRKL